MRRKLVTSQKQGVIKLLGKKDKDKSLTSNWRPLSSLNVDYRIISKIFASKLKKVLQNFISSDLLIYVIPDLLSVTKKVKVKVYLVANDFEKTFDSLNHTFLISALEKSGFIDWIKIFLNERESCVINGGIILCLEILFMLIKDNKHIKGIKMFENTFLYTACLDDSTFFLKDKNSVKKLLNTINDFLSFTALKPNLSKCEVAGIGALKGFKMAICGIKLIGEAIKILGVFFPYDEYVQLKKNFR